MLAETVTVTFDLAGVIERAEHAISGDGTFWDHRGTEPAILVVHDDGVYVMSNANPRCDDAVWSAEYPPGSWLHGDDFCDPIPLAHGLLGDLRVNHARGLTQFQIDITDTNFALRYLP